jgi:1,4-alpha-glucan branching enzyme
MGGEFGQFIEWDEKRPLDWFLLDYPHHRQLQDFTKDLNHLYKKEKSLWQYDFDPAGFTWIDADDSTRSVVSYVRRAKNPDDTLIIACNFTPNPIENHRLGLHSEPHANYVEIFNSDHPKYGGSGVINEGLIKPQKITSNHQEYSIPLRLPPLGSTILKPVKS